MPGRFSFACWCVCTVHGPTVAVFHLPVGVFVQCMDQLWLRESQWFGSTVKGDKTSGFAHFGILSTVTFRIPRCL